MAEAKSGQIVNVMKEERLFPPPKEFAKKACIGSMKQYEKMWKEAAADPGAFWGKMGGECIGSSLTPKCWSGTSPLPNGLSAARPMFPTTASTPIWTPLGETRRP